MNNDYFIFIVDWDVRGYSRIGRFDQEDWRGDQRLLVENAVLDDADVDSNSSDNESLEEVLGASLGRDRPSEAVALANWIGP